MEFLDADNFDPLRPDIFKGDPAEWNRRANAYLMAKVRELREKQASLNLVPGAQSDLDVLLNGKSENGTCAIDGKVEMDGEREELVKMILARRHATARTGLAGGL
jgi:hypothetical protein